MSGKILAAAIISLTIATGAAVSTGIYSNGFESFSPLYVTVGDQLYSDDAELSLETTDDVTFEVKGAGFKATEYAEYSVKAVVEAEDASGIYYRSNVTDKLITLTETGFTLTPVSTSALITSEYPDADFSTAFDYDFGYTVTITNASGDKEINLTFVYTGEIPVYDIEIDPDEIIF